MTASAGRRRSLAVRITLLCLVVAGVMAVVAGLISARLVAGTAEDVTRKTLSDQADVVAAQRAEVGLGSNVGARRVVEILRGQDVTVVLRRRTGALTPADGLATRAARQAGIDQVTPARPVHRTVHLDGKTLLVEARGIDDSTAVALVREAATARATGRRLISNVILALGIGLLVATVAGLVLAGRLSRPLRRISEVAAGMRHGRRDLRAPVEGPSEVAEVAESVNELADALRRSESRQREFLLSVSHELRTPLTGVKGFAESLADGVVTGPDVPAAGRVIQQEAGRLERLVNDLLDLARLGADDFRLDLVEVDLTSLVAETAQVWHARCDAAGVVFVVDDPGASIRVRTDPRRLRQVLDGLAENALRVTPPGAPMVLALRAHPGVAVLQVRDGGPGLSQEDYGAAFQRGVLHSRYAGTRPVGTGIGLALAHALVTRMGGTIEAGPAPEGGACFTVTLAVAPRGSVGGTGELTQPLQRPGR